MITKQLPWQWIIRSEAERFFVALLYDPTRLAFPKQVATAMWRMIEASTDTEAAAFRFHTFQAVKSLQGTLDVQAERCITIFFDEWMTPDLISGALEELCTRGELSPQGAARLQAKLQAYTTTEGAWRW